MRLVIRHWVAFPYHDGIMCFPDAPPASYDLLKKGKRQEGSYRYGYYSIYSGCIDCSFYSEVVAVGYVGVVGDRGDIVYGYRHVAFRSKTLK